MRLAGPFNEEARRELIAAGVLRPSRPRNPDDLTPLRTDPPALPLDEWARVEVAREIASLPRDAQGRPMSRVSAPARRRAA